MALDGGKVVGAGLDVVLLPHIASSTRETRSEMGRLVIKKLEARFSSRPLVTPTPETLAMLANR